MMDPDDLELCYRNGSLVMKAWWSGAGGTPLIENFYPPLKPGGPAHCVFYSGSFGGGYNPDHCDAYAGPTP